MKTELLLKFVFEASHSLASYETPHRHLWRLEMTVEGEPMEGRILDMVILRERIQKQIDPLNHIYLNEYPHTNAQVREFPTCETLSGFFTFELQKILAEEFLSQNPTIKLTSVLVAICSIDGTELGAVRLRP